MFRIMDAISLFLYRMAALVLVFIMLIICLDVLLRTLFSVSDGAIDLTLSGGIELVRFGLMFCMLLAFPYAVNKGQIIVDIFTANMAVNKRDYIDGFYMLVFAVFAALLCWRFGEGAHVAYLNGEQTQDLMLAMEWLYGPASAILALVSVQSLLGGLRLWLHARHRPEPMAEHQEESHV